MTTLGQPAGLARPTPEDARPTVDEHAEQDDNRAAELQESERSAESDRDGDPED